jgi:nitrate reductase delta subunit
MRILRALSALLDYPTPELVAAADEISEAIGADAAIPASSRKALLALVADLKASDLFELQEQYVLLFDRTRSLSLHVFEHVHGESRDRGQALVDLRNVYEQHGLAPDGNELPDFLPLFLEFLSVLPEAEAKLYLGEIAHVTTALAERLARRGSKYEAIPRALLAIAGAKPGDLALDALRAEPEPAPDDLEALDAAWADEAVMFGPGAANACGDDLSAKIRQGRRPAPGVEAQIRAARAPRPQAQ